MTVWFWRPIAAGLGNGVAAALFAFMLRFWSNVTKTIDTPTLMLLAFAVMGGIGYGMAAILQGRR